MFITRHSLKDSVEATKVAIGKGSAKLNDAVRATGRTARRLAGSFGGVVMATILLLGAVVWVFTRFTLHLIWSLRNVFMFVGAGYAITKLAIFAWVTFIATWPIAMQVLAVFVGVGLIGMLLASLNAVIATA